MSLFLPEHRPMMAAVLDRLVPGVDDLPGAGVMGVLDDIERMVGAEDRFGAALLRFAEAVSAVPDFVASSGEAQDRAIAAIEAASPADFALVLEISYFAYYSRPEVHARIGWRTGPLQPLGFELPPFDESVLEAVRQRAPLWRRT